MRFKDIKRASWLRDAYFILKETSPEPPVKIGEDTALMVDAVYR